MEFTLSRRKKGRKILYISKRMRCTTINSHVNSSESDNLNKSNRDNVIGNSNPPRINVQTESTFNTPINLKKETDTESNISVNDEMIDEKNISEEISSHHNSEKVIDHTFDDNGKKYAIQKKKQI